MNFLCTLILGHFRFQGTLYERAGFGHCTFFIHKFIHIFFTPRKHGIVCSRIRIAAAGLLPVPASQRSPTQTPSVRPWAR